MAIRNAAPPPVRNSVSPPQDDVHIPEQPVLEDEATDNSSLGEEFYLLPPSRAKPRPMPKSKHDPSLLTTGRQFIETRGEALDVPFLYISDAIRDGLQDAERTGSPKQILAKLTRLAQKEALKQVANNFDSDVEETSNSSKENLLECIRRIMVVEAAMLQSSSNGPMKNNRNGAHKACMVSSIPPGGMLNMKGAPGESIPAIEQLNIQEYSNQAYWKFAPYLEDVCYTLKPTRRHISNYFRGSVANLRNCINLTAKDYMLSRRRTFRSCAATRKVW